MTFQVAFQVLFQLLVMMNSVQCHIAIERAQDLAEARTHNCSEFDAPNESACKKNVTAAYEKLESELLDTPRCQTHVFAPLLTGVLVLFALLGITKELFVLLKSVRLFRVLLIYSY